ncbi:MAG: hypothetical protein K1X55_06580 [Chitinophagales bacterium]|nr:hypothetical protein [Chitinophagales bacterium]
MSKELSKKLLEAHVAFELEQWEGSNLISGLNNEIDAAWEYFSKKKIKDLIKKQTIIEAYDRNLKEVKITKEQKDYFQDLYRELHQKSTESDYAVKDFLSRKNYDKLVKRIAGMKELREDLIKRAVSNPFYAEMISNTLYNGIKNFLSSEDSPASKITGSSLFKIGSGLLGNALSGMEDTIDKNVKKFLSNNLQKTISQSESYLKEQLSDQNIQKMATDAWDKIEDIELAELAKFLKPKDANAYTPIIEDIFEELRKDGVLKEIGHIVINHFFEYCGDMAVQDFLKDINIDREKIKVEATVFALPLIEKMRKDGFIEKRIRERLSKFYQSEKFSV